MSQYENFQQTSSHSDTATASGRASSGEFVNRPGGVMELRVNADQNYAPLTGSHTVASIQANMGGVTTVNAGGEVRTSGSIQTVSTSALNGGHSDFLGTARNSGIPARGNLQPSSVVQYQGIEADLATLESMGVVRRSANGSYDAVEGGNGQQLSQPEQAQHQDNLPAGVELFPSEIEAAVSHAIDPIPQHLYDQAVAVALENGLDAVGWNEIAFQSGMTPAEAQQRAQYVVQAFTAQADHVAKSHGIDNPAEFYEWAALEHGEKFADARRQLAFGRNTSVLKSLANDYFTSVPPTVEALQKAGFAVRQDGSGNTVFNLRGNWMTPEAAARAGLI